MRTSSDSTASALLLASRGKQIPPVAQEISHRGANSPFGALRLALLIRALVDLLPRLCLPLLDGHYPASWLLRRLCHLLGRVLRTGLAGHERPRCSQIVIPDSPHSNFLPFCLQPPHAFLSPRSLSRRSAGRRSCLALHGSAFGSRLRLCSAGSPMHQAESSSSFFFLTDWQFASGCSPPRLSTTQLPSASDSQCSVRRGLPPLCRCALSGARAALSRAPFILVGG
jgi:hypothetical protein